MSEDPVGYGEDLATQEGQPEVLTDLLTGEERRATPKEQTVRHMIEVLNREYGFPLEMMARDVPFVVETGDGKRRTRTADLVIREASAPYATAAADRVVVVQPPGTKPNDRSKGVDLLKDLLDSAEPGEFGVWTNGRDVAYLRKRSHAIQSEFEELTDFPGHGESLEDLNRPDRRISRVPVGQDLRETILRCHDYLYGNQAMTAPRAFAEIVKLIFCKVYDEQQLRADPSYRRQFWVGATERNTPDGQARITHRIKGLFAEVRGDRLMRDVFRQGDEIELEPKVLAWVAGELGRYQFLDAEVDVKGMAYEAISATTMKRERGQFFTPRNVVDAMVEILYVFSGLRRWEGGCRLRA